MAILITSKTADDDKNRWATNWQAFNDAQLVTGLTFILDACAEENTKKCEHFISPHDVDSFGNEDHALQTSWKNRFQKAIRSLSTISVTGQPVKPSGIWCNPPFDDKQPFINAAYQESKNTGIPIVMMLPYQPQTIWWLCMVEGVANKIYRPDRRYQYLETDGKTMKRGVNFDSCFVLFDGGYTDKTQTIDFSVDYIRSPEFKQPKNIIELAAKEAASRNSSKAKTKALALFNKRKDVHYG